MRKYTSVALLVLAMTIGCRSERPQYSVVKIDGKAYTGGLVWIKSASDTTALIKVGFSHLNGPYPGDASVYYVAWWPAKMKASKSTAILNLKPLGLEKQDDSVVVTKTPRRYPLARPPADYPTADINGFKYVGARLSMASGSDVALLIPFGFHGFDLPFQTPDADYYLAYSPKELPWNYLPPRLLGLAYDPPAEPAN